MKTILVFFTFLSSLLFVEMNDRQLSAKIAQLEDGRLADKIRLDILQLYCTGRYDFSLKRQKRQIFDPYIQLASKLDSLKKGVEEIRFLEDDKNWTNKQHQKMKFSRLLFLTEKLSRELIRFQMGISRRNIDSVVNYRLSEMEKVERKLQNMEQKMHEYQRINSLKFKELIENVTQSRSISEAKLSIENDKFGGIFDASGSGSGDELMEFLPITSSKIEREQRRMSRNMEEIATNLTKVMNILSQDKKYQKELNLRLNSALTKIDRAENVGKIVKRVQNRHFDAILNFSRKLHQIDYDVTKYGLKLTSLQADYLNSTLFMNKEIGKDLQQDAKLLKLEIRVKISEGKFPVISRNIENLEYKLFDKIDFAKFKELKELLNTVQDKLSFYSSNLNNLRKILKLSEDSVFRLESQLPYDCSMDKLPRTHFTNKNGIHLIKPKNSNRTIFTQCKNGWTVIQNRTFGLHFNRTFVEYSKGFGNAMDEDYWLGNEVIHRLTVRKKMQLKVETWDIYNDFRFAIYNHFKLADKDDFYRLYLGNYSGGNLTDSLSEQQGMRFSAYDVDEDTSSTHCARYYHSGWWFGNCHKANLNGNFLLGLVWFDREQLRWFQLKKTSMSIQ